MSVCQVEPHGSTTPLVLATIRTQHAFAGNLAAAAVVFFTHKPVGDPMLLTSTIVTVNSLYGMTQLEAVVVEGM